MCVFVSKSAREKSIAQNGYCCKFVRQIMATSKMLYVLIILLFPAIFFFILASSFFF